MEQSNTPPVNVALIVYDYSSGDDIDYPLLSLMLFNLGYLDSRIVPHDMTFDNAIGKQKIDRIIVIDLVKYDHYSFLHVQKSVYNRLKGLSPDVIVTYILNYPKEVKQVSKSKMEKLPLKHCMLAIFYSISSNMMSNGATEKTTFFHDYIIAFFESQFGNGYVYYDYSFREDKMYILDLHDLVLNSEAPLSWARRAIRHYRITKLDYVYLSDFGLELERLRDDDLVPKNMKQETCVTYEVWYGTNRKKNTNRQGKYLTHRDNKVHYGKCIVGIPKKHKIGSTGSPWWKRIFLGDDRIRLEGVSELSQNKFVTQLREEINCLPNDEKTGIIFIHGYNVNFKDAALNAAQLGFDLQIKGPVSFFSWPSHGAVQDYLADEAAIEASEQYIKDFIKTFACDLGLTTIHIIAHSMGNRALLRVVNRIVNETEKFSNANFGHFILAAPDVDKDVFNSLATAYKIVAAHTTLYVSNSDKALAASKFLHQYPRAGLSPPITVLPDMDTVHAGDIDLSFLGHSYFSGSREVLTDIHNLIHNGTPAEKRMGLRWEKGEHGRGYWRIAN